MNTQQLIEHVKLSLVNAEKLQSKLTEEPFKVPAMSSPRIRHLLNNLGSAPELDYFEVGVHKGGTFVATLFGNDLHSAIAVDNWSEFIQEGASKKEFYSWCETFLADKRHKIFEMDCFRMSQRYFKDPVTLYFYDGDHGEEAQAKAITYFKPFLAEAFILLVDDFNWESTSRGTFTGLREANMRVLFEQRFTQDGVEGWWNGLYVAVVEKM